MTSIDVSVGMLRNADRSIADNFRPVGGGMTRGGGRFDVVPFGVTASTSSGTDGVLVGAIGLSKTSRLWSKEYTNVTGRRVSGL